MPEDLQGEIATLVWLTSKAVRPKFGGSMSEVWLNGLVPKTPRPRCAELLESIGAELGAKPEGMSRMLKERKLDRIALWLVECDCAEDLMARIRAT